MGCHVDSESGCFKHQCMKGYIKNADGIGCIAVDTPGPSIITPKCTCNTPHLGCGYPCSAVNRNFREIRRECYAGEFTGRGLSGRVSCHSRGDLIRHTITESTWTCSKEGYTDSELCSRISRKCEAPKDSCGANNVCFVSSDGPRTCTYTEAHRSRLRFGKCQKKDHTCGPDRY